MGKTLLAVFLFGASFGYTEAALVSYLRALYDPVRARIHPEVPAEEIFPLLTLAQLRADGPDHMHRLATEVAREAATLVMLVAVALAAAGTFRQWLAAFMIAFGTWDIFYYAFLKALIDWPASLLTWDILFLIPVPWVGPVVAPMVVSLSMIIAGLIIFQREYAGCPIRFRWPHWTILVISGLAIVVAFCWDYDNVMAGGRPNPFHWPLFTAGELSGCAAFWHALSIPPSPRRV